MDGPEDGFPPAADTSCDWLVRALARANGHRLGRVSEYIEARARPRLALVPALRAAMEAAGAVPTSTSSSAAGASTAASREAAAGGASVSPGGAADSAAPTAASEGWAFTSRCCCCRTAEWNERDELYGPFLEGEPPPGGGGGGAVAAVTALAPLSPPPLPAFLPLPAATSREAFEAEQGRRRAAGGTRGGRSVGTMACVDGGDDVPHFLVVPPPAPSPAQPSCSGFPPGEGAAPRGEAPPYDVAAAEVDAAAGVRLVPTGSLLLEKVCGGVPLYL